MCYHRRTLDSGGPMTRTRNAILVALWLLGPAFLASPAGAQDEVRLGAFAPISGISADVAAQIKAGIEVAVERTESVPLGGKPARVRVIWYDTEGKGDVGLNVVTRALTVDKIHAGIGFLSSDVLLRGVDEFDKASRTMWAGCVCSLKDCDEATQTKA